MDISPVEFSAGDGREFFVTEYDPFDLWRDAEIICYYPIEPATPAV